MTAILFRLQLVWLWLVSFPIGWWAYITRDREADR